MKLHESTIWNSNIRLNENILGNYDPTNQNHDLIDTFNFHIKSFSFKDSKAVI